MMRRRGNAVSTVAGASLPTPAEVFGAALLHEYDAYYSTIVQATGVSSISDLQGSDNLTQGTGTKQPAYTSAGELSYVTSDGTDDWLSDNSMTDWGGDVTLLIVAKHVTLIGGGFLAAGLSARVSVLMDATSFQGRIIDATGTDTISGPARDTSLHAFVLRNATGVARKFYVDGGAGTAGARTSASLGSTLLTAHSNQFNHSNSQIYWLGIVNPSPSLAQLNQWGAWAAGRFGLSWTTAT